MLQKEWINQSHYVDTPQGPGAGRRERVGCVSKLPFISEWNTNNDSQVEIWLFAQTNGKNQRSIYPLPCLNERAYLRTNTKSGERCAGCRESDFRAIVMRPYPDLIPSVSISWMNMVDVSIDDVITRPVRSLLLNYVYSWIPILSRMDPSHSIQLIYH